MEKTIKITENTHYMLCKEGNKGETFDQVIARLILEKKGDKNGNGNDRR